MCGSASEMIPMVGKWFGKDPRKPLEVRKPRSRASARADQLGAGEAAAVSLPRDRDRAAASSEGP